MTRIICFDLETTGFNYTGGDRVIEIGAIEVLGGKITQNTFHEYINPDGKIIPPDSYKVHKLSNAFLEDKPKFRDVAQKMLDFIGDSPVVAHNGIDFDFPFINFELKNLGLPQIPRDKQMDTLVIARHKIFGPKEYTLDALAKWFGISLESRADGHGALIDTEILAKIYLELENADAARDISDIIAEQNENFTKIPKGYTIFPARNFPIPQTDIENHNKFMEQFKTE
ncbi:MAG: ribonuclease H-like domain-containing protein [Rickettsiales bacterium]|jgi:DNA polymerase-3 subunit epsilon|nr:ribonuclease H-like domain-containing protein [Rickettsiales bacterium]